MKLFFSIIVIIVVTLGLAYLLPWKGDKNLSDKNDLIRVVTPEVNTIIESPLVIRGEARGNWYFEASFPIRLLDSEGKELAVGIAQAQGDPATPGEVNWMTTEFVPFEAKLIFVLPTTKQTGTLLLEKDNPSGLPEYDDELRIPVRLEADRTQTRIIKLFYYNESKDMDTSGNILCSKKGLESVERQVPLSITPIQDAIKLLLQGELTFMERSRGISTEFPLSGLDLVSASLKNGSLTLTFADSQNKTGGGSCRVNILRAQIEATAKQFDEVNEVYISPAELFQP